MATSGMAIQKLNRPFANTDLPVYSNISPATTATAAITITTTWLERLFMNLLSYSIIIVPIAFIVIATKCELLPRSIRFNFLIQRFVYGSPDCRELTHMGTKTDEDTNKLLLDDKTSKSTLTPSTSKVHGALEFIMCLAGLLISYIIWGWLQEKIMTTEYSMIGSNKMITFHESQFLVLYNRLVAFILSVLMLLYTERARAQIYANRYANGAMSAASQISTTTSGKPQAPLYEFIYCSLTNILSSWCQYEALKYINFPTQCLSKSCKTIPTMIMGKIMLGKRYSSRDYFSATMLASGMFVFMLNQTQADNGKRKATLTNGAQEKQLTSNSLMFSGAILLSLYLVCDSFTSNWQKRLNNKYATGKWQMMTAVNFYSILLTLTSLQQLDNLRPAFHLMASSQRLTIDCFTMSLASAIGQIFIFRTIINFGPDWLSVMMTLRQLLSMILSCQLYGHEITFGSWLGLSLVLLIVAYQTCLKLFFKETNKSKVHLPVSSASKPINLFKSRDTRNNNI